MSLQANSCCSGTPKTHCMIDADMDTRMLNSNWRENIQVRKTYNAENLTKEYFLNLAIVSMMDAVFARKNEYNGSMISVEEDWDQQIGNTEAATLENPLRVFPLFPYDPRRYKFPLSGGPNHDTEKWKEPFARIVGAKDNVDGVKKIWLGFALDPAIGFRPSDISCKHLPDFYKKCEDEEIPILARCTQEKAATKNADGDVNLDPFYSNGHPANWGMVLADYPKLRLCLAGFGGNEVWGNQSMTSWASKYATIERLVKKQEASNIQFGKLTALQGGGGWIHSIIEHTQRNDNVYTDISGFDISNDDVRDTLKIILLLAFKDDENYKHLKDKIIFGSGWDKRMEQNSNEVRYSECCDGFIELFNEVENEVRNEGCKLEDGEVWERLSLINPWRFYALSKQKLIDMHRALSKAENDENLARETLRTLFKIDDYVLRKLNIKGEYNAEQMERMHFGGKEDIDLRKTKNLEWKTQIEEVETLKDGKWEISYVSFRECLEACIDILTTAGLSKESAPKDTAIKVATEISNVSVENRKDSTKYLKINELKAKEGLAYIDQQLEEGYPVIVGVDHTYGNTYNEGTTDHFVVIVGRGCNDGKAYYYFYDVGTYWRDKGNSDENKLYLEDDISLRGTPVYNTNRKYTVSQVRRNKLP